MKKIIALMLSVIMVISLSACGNKTTDNTQNSITTENKADSVSNEVSNEAVSSVAVTTPEPTIESAPTDEPEAVEATVEEVAEVTPEPEEIIPPEVYLKDVFAAHNMKVGTCLTTQMINDDEYEELILKQFNSITMENAMKPDYIFNKNLSKEKGEPVIEFNSDVLKMLEWAKNNNMAVRGHTIVWYSQTPDWIFYKDFDKANGMVERDEMLARLESIIRQIFENLTELGYADLFYAYDIINEAWMEDGSKRKTNWQATIGDDYMWYAFYYANMYAPENIDLYYNDYNEQFKADTFVDFVETLKDENGNYLIDGIGLQAHLYTQDNQKQYFKAVEKLAATGLKLQMTELDVSLGAWQNTLPGTEENLKTQGQYYYDLINGLFERADNGTISMDSITFWGFADNLSWRKSAKPLLYNRNLDPKFAYYGAAQIKELAGFDD